ncbi:condensation domain-containing protein, partial [Virgisporangium aurantiacum]|uniref:condensation domain-containing protein n=1 Tax=Virgisporangium aurantiacum TaxID=175570 RepID=UPI001EF2C7E6
MAELWQHLTTHHDVMRLRLTPTADGDYAEHIDPPGPGHFSLTVAAPAEAGRRDQALIELADLVYAEIDPVVGPLVGLGLLPDADGGPGRLFIAVHHLAIDVVSWSILLDHLNIAYRQRAAGEAVRLPGRTTPYQVWAHQLNNRTPAPPRRTVPAPPTPAPPATVPDLPADHLYDPDIVDTHATARHHHVRLDQASTRALLGPANAAYHTRTDDLLLTALTRTILRWTGQHGIHVDLETHGRDQLPELDTSATIGWFTQLRQVWLTADPDSPPTATLKHIKETLRQPAEAGADMGNSRIEFNYVGRAGQQSQESAPLHPVTGGPVPPPPLHSARPHELSFQIRVDGDQLRLEITYSPARHEASTIADLAMQYLHELSDLVTDCTTAGNTGTTPSDHPLAGLTQEQLDTVAATHPHVTDLYPLTPTQQGLLFHTLYEPGSGVYVVQLALRLEGNLKVPAFT